MLGPSVEQRLERAEQRVRAAERDGDVVDVALDLVLAGELRGERFAQVALAPRVGVMRLAATRGAVQRLDNVRRGVEVGLATLQVHDRQACLVTGAGIN